MESIVDKRSAFLSQFPRQKISTKKKNDAWIEQCVDAALDMTIYSDDNRIRMSRSNRESNYGLIDGIIDKRDMFKITNPWGLDGFDRELVDYPLIRPRLNLLLGEEYSRRFDWQIATINPEAVSEKEKLMKNYLFEEVSKIAMDTAFDEKQAQQRLADLDKYMRYTFQDLREKMAKELLNYFWRKLNLREKFNKGMSDAIIAAEEIYHVDIVGGEPDVRVVNPLNLYVIRNNDSSYIEDSDIIVEDGYASIGWVIDKWYDYLTPKQIDELERGLETDSKLKTASSSVNYEKAEPYSLTGANIILDTKDLKRKTEPFDENGNVRVSRVTWRSLRKIGEITYYDEAGNEFKEYVDENYPVDKDSGVDVKWIWVNEWWNAIRLGDDMIIKSGPNKMQFRSRVNKSMGGSGYIGTIYNVNSNIAYSLVDAMKPYQYLYDEIMDRLKEVLAKFQGPIIELDFAKMPDNWTPEKWLYYMQKLGYMIVDSFKEGTKGAATGTLAGTFNTTGKIMNADLGNYIQQHIAMLQFIESKIGTITGINEQRLGSIDTREQVGSVERAVTQSSHITEKYYQLHDNTKLRVLSALLEVAKFAYKDRQDMLQYITDEMTSSILKLDGESLNEAEYGIFLSNTPNDKELMSVIKQMAHAAMQNDRASLSDVIGILMSSSISEMRRKLEMSEEKFFERQEQSAQGQREAEAAMQERIMQDKAEDRELKERDSIRKSETSITVAEINNDKEETATPDNNLDVRKQDFNEYIEDEKLKETKRSNRAKEDIQRSKSVSSNKNKK